MKAMALLLVTGMSLTGAVVELVPGPTVSVFGGGRRAMDVLFRNQTQTNVQLLVGLQVLQSSSATTVPWSEPRPWRSLALMPRQTSIERAEIDFPVVRSESPFLVRFSSGQSVLGLVSVRVYPSNVLSRLVDCAGPITVSGVQPELSQVLVDAGFNLIEGGVPPKSGVPPQLAVFGPNFSGTGATVSVGEAMSRAKPGLGVVLILSDHSEQRITAPSYYPFRVNGSTVVVVREATLIHLPTDPLAQLRLARIIHLALGQENLKPPQSDL